MRIYNLRRYIPTGFLYNRQIFFKTIILNSLRSHYLNLYRAIHEQKTFFNIYPLSITNPTQTLRTKENLRISSISSGSKIKLPIYFNKQYYTDLSHSIYLTVFNIYASANSLNQQRLESSRSKGMYRKRTSKESKFHYIIRVLYIYV